MRISPFSLTRNLLAALPAEATCADRLVACVLASYASSTGELWPHNRTIAALCALDVRSVRRCVARLEGWGLLARPGRFHPGATSPAMRRIELPGIGSEDSDNGPQGPEGGLPSPGAPDTGVRGTQDTTVPPLKRTPKYEQPEEQPPIAPRRGAGRSLPLTERDSEFAKFYQAYPRKVGRGQAERAWRGAIRAGAKPAEIISGLEAQLPAMREQDQRFVPHPATWLNGQRWLDEPPETTEQALDRMVAEMSRAAWEKQQRAAAQ